MKNAIKLLEIEWSRIYRILCDEKLWKLSPKRAGDEKKLLLKTLEEIQQELLILKNEDK